MNSVVDLFSTFAGNRNQLQPWLADATINRDRNLKLQYLAGLGVHLYQSDVIYARMLRHADYPQGTFTGSDGDALGSAAGDATTAREIGTCRATDVRRAHVRRADVPRA